MYIDGVCVNVLVWEVEIWICLYINFLKNHLFADLEKNGMNNWKLQRKNLIVLSSEFWVQSRQFLYHWTTG